MIMLHKCDIDPYCDITFILLNVQSTELLRDFWTQNNVIIIINNTNSNSVDLVDEIDTISG